MISNVFMQYLTICWICSIGSMLYSGELLKKEIKPSFFFFNEFGQTLRKVLVHSVDKLQTVVHGEENIKPFESRIVHLPDAKKNYVFTITTEDKLSYSGALCCSQEEIAQTSVQCSAETIGRVALIYNIEQNCLCLMHLNRIDVIDHCDEFMRADQNGWHVPVMMTRCDEEGELNLTLPSDQKTRHVLYSGDILLKQVSLNDVAAKPLAGLNEKKSEGYNWILRNKDRQGPFTLVCKTTDDITYTWEVPVVVQNAEFLLFNNFRKVPQLFQLDEYQGGWKNYAYPNVQLNSASDYLFKCEKHSINELLYFYYHCYYVTDVEKVLRLWPLFYREFCTQAIPLLDRLIVRPTSKKMLLNFIKKYHDNAKIYVQFIILKALKMYVCESHEEWYRMAFAKVNEHKNSDVLILLREALALIPILLYWNCQDVAASALDAVRGVYKKGVFVNSLRSECNKIVAKLVQCNCLKIDDAEELLALVAKYNDYELKTILNRYDLADLN